MFSHDLAGTGCLVRSRIRGDVRDLFVHGALTIEGDTGRLREEYRTPTSKDRLEVSSRYSNVRRFQVTVDEHVAVPSADRESHRSCTLTIPSP